MSVLLTLKKVVVFTYNSYWNKLISRSRFSAKHEEPSCDTLRGGSCRSKKHQNQGPEGTNGSWADNVCIQLPVTLL